MNPLVRTDGDNGAFLIWGDFRSGSLSIYVQRITVYNNLSFDQNGQVYVSS